MLLAIDVGNSNISVGVCRFASDRTPELVCHFKFGTNNYSPDELSVTLEGFLRRFGVLTADGTNDASALNAAVISSVVPQLTDAVRIAAESLCGVQPFIIANGIKTGFNFRIKNPEQLGTDIVSNVAAALAKADAPLAVLDMGTATTITVVDNNLSILGTIIIPGLRTSLNALCSSAAQLSDIPLDGNLELIGRDTRASISSGVLNGSAYMIDGFIRNIREELGLKESGTSLSLVATGGLFPLVRPLLRNKFLYSETLTLLGQCRLYAQNHKILS